MRSNLFKKIHKSEKNIFVGDGANMAACHVKFSSLTLEDGEIMLAVNLAEALRIDEVETFLEIYDSIPSTTEIKRVDEIKEMARQLAALPKKQFEIYRTKKILTNEHSFQWPGSSQVIKDKLSSNFISKTVISNVEKDLSVIQNQVEVLGSSDQVENTAKPKTSNKKKRVKSKKGKSANSVAVDTVENGINSVANGAKEPDISAVANETGKTGNSNLDMKHKILGSENNCVPLCISMNTNLVADISTGHELETGQHSKSSRTDLGSCESSLSNDTGIVTPKELFLNDDIKEVDSGLGSYTSPVFSKEPPFGFPPSSQKLLESALGLLPNAAHESSSYVAETPENTEDFFQQSEDLGSNHVLQAVKIDNTLLKKKNCNSTHVIEDDPVSDVSDTKELCKDFVVIEGDSVDGDVSSSSAVEDEGGWQSQTRRSHRRKKKELAARASREKNHMDRFQRKDFHKQQSDNHFRKNHHRRKSVDDKKNHSKASEKMFQKVENKISNVMVESSADSHSQDNNHKDNELKATKGLNVTSDNKSSSQKETLPTQKVLSYRDALLKAKGKAEPTESSDSGVDANSVSSCELSNIQPEEQNDSFNKEQCVDYLRNAWKKVMSNAKQGQVIYFKVDSDPVLCEQKRKKLAGSNRGTSSKAQ